MNSSDGSPRNSQIMAVDRLAILCLLMVVLSLAHVSATGQTPEPPQTKEEQLRQLELEQARLEMEQAQKRMYKKKADWQEYQRLKTQDIMTGVEVNQAKELFEDAKLVFEKAVLNLRQIELDSLKAAWHISITEVRRYETRDGSQMLAITLENNSQPVQLKYSMRAFEQLNAFEQTIPQADREELSPQVKALFSVSSVSPQIDDIFVSILDKSQSVVARPYEIWIQTLGYSKKHSLQFELIKKDIQDVVVSLRYMDRAETRDIHLQQEEPYITVLRARRYKSQDDRRRLDLMLRYGSVRNTEGDEDRGNGGQEDIETSGLIAESDSLTAQSAYATELNNIRVSIQDETGAIIGLPYEMTIETMKYRQEVPLDFELRRNVNNIIVALKYLNSESGLHLYLEPDTHHLSILSATKYRQDEQMRVSLVLKNTSRELPKAGATEEELAALNELRSIYVSLQGENGTIIAQPYDASIDVLGYNSKKTLDFQLQKDVDEVTVALEYADVVEQRKVYLQKESEKDIVDISSMQFSQEGDLGRSVSYDLALSRLAENENTFVLRVINLPDPLSFEFLDSESESRISRVKFTQAQPRRNLSLTVYLPEELDISLLDQPMDFYVAVLDDKEADLYGLENRIQLTAEPLGQLESGKEHLQLIPRGVPRFELTSTNLWYDIKTGQQVQLKAKLTNIGTRDLDDIRLVVESPSDWKTQVEPEVVPSLKRQEEHDLQILILPPADIRPGDYEAKMGAETTVDNRKVEAIEKTIRVHLSSPKSLTGSVLLIGGIILLIGGVAVLSIRLSRR